MEDCIRAKRTGATLSNKHSVQISSTLFFFFSLRRGKLPLYVYIYMYIRAESPYSTLSGGV